jgi:hypothetical protein
MGRMANPLRDAVLILMVAAALFFTGSAIFGLGRRLPPPPDVRSTPTTQVTPDVEQLP